MFYSSGRLTFKMFLIRFLPVCHKNV
jgi:hypothetical protein